MHTIPIYVINLRRTPERKFHIQRQLDALRLNYRYVDAIDLYELKSPAYRAEIARSLGIDGSNLEYKNAATVRIAYLLSHTKAYNLILEHNEQMACILEDDAVLLPTFPAVLAAAVEHSWDILMLSNHSKSIRDALEKWNGIRRRIMKSRDYVLLMKCRPKKTPDVCRHIAALLGFPSDLYPKQSQAVIKILTQFRGEYKDLMELYDPKQRLLCLLSATATAPTPLQPYKNLIYRASCQLGGLPVAGSQHMIRDKHCIAEPAEKHTSAMAYIVTRSAAQKWKSVAAARNTLELDSIPWHLYMQRQVRLRFVSLPCVVAAPHYLKYSTYQKYPVHRPSPASIESA